MAKARVQTVRDLAGSRFDWEQALRDLSRAVPADVTLKSLTGDISTDAGGGGSPLRGAISAPAITLHGLRARPDAGRPPDGAPAQHRRRDARRRSASPAPRWSTRPPTRPAPSSSSATPRRAAPASARRSRSSCSSRRRAPPWPATPTTATGTVSASRPRRATPTATPTPEAGTTTASTTTPPGRGHPVSRTFRILLVAVVAFGAVGGYWKLRPGAQARAGRRARAAGRDPAGPARPDAEPDRHLPGRA